MEGWLLREPAPALRHGRVQSRILVPLATHVRDHGLGEVHAELGFVLARKTDNVRAPDVCFLSSIRLAGIEDDSRLVQGGPDLAVEVLSPSNGRGEMHGKIADLLAAGTRLVWVVDPKRRTVTVYRTPLPPRVLREGDVLEGEDVVAGFLLPVTALFPR